MTAPYAGIYVPPGQSIQRMQRAWRVFTDQHGRRFGAISDIRNNTPVEEFQPQGFNPPWLPTPRHAKFAQPGDLEFRWDYDTIAEDWSAVAASYYEEAGNVALKLPGSIPVPEIGGPVAREIRIILGKPPLSPAIPLACKAGDPWALGKLGATDALGLKQILEQSGSASGQEALKAIQDRLDKMAMEANVPLVPTLPEKTVEAERHRSITTVDEDAPIEAITYNQFVAQGRARGVSMAELALAWKAHKENMGVAA